jgi:hypothetical protein
MRLSSLFYLYIVNKQLLLYKMATTCNFGQVKDLRVRSLCVDGKEVIDSNRQLDCITKAKVGELRVRQNAEVCGDMVVKGVLKANLCPTVGIFEINNEEASLDGANVSSIVLQQSNLVSTMLRLLVPPENGLSLSPNTELLVGQIFDVDYPAFFSARGEAAVYVDGAYTSAGTVYVNPNGFICVASNDTASANITEIQATVTYPVLPLL